MIRPPSLPSRPRGRPNMRIRRSRLRLIVFRSDAVRASAALGSPRSPEIIADVGTAAERQREQEAFCPGLMHPVDISGRVALLIEKLPHAEDHRRRKSQEVAQRNDIRRLRSVGPILFCWRVTLTDLLLVIEPSLITVTPAQIGNPADKASPHRRLISLIGSCRRGRRTI